MSNNRPQKQLKKPVIKSKKDVWYKLDLSATVYPTLQRRDFSSVYRLSVKLKDNVDPALLQQALDLTLPRFPTYKVAIRKGLFWRYLEPNSRPGPFVQEDIKNPCMPMHFKSNNRYLIRVYYYGSRISLEAHHCLGDGTGGMCLLQTLTSVYLGLLGHKITPSGFVLKLDEDPDPGELEDAYMRYATAKVKPPRPSEKTYRIRGTKEPFYTLNIVDGVMSVSEVMKTARQYGATITEYLNAVLLYALLQKQTAEFHLKYKPVRIAMPVNLRRFFPSKTLRNFITMVYPSIDPRLGEYSFEEIVTQVKIFMRRYHHQRRHKAQFSDPHRTSFFERSGGTHLLHQSAGQKFLRRSHQYGRPQGAGGYETIHRAFRYLYGAAVFLPHKLRHHQF